MTFGERLKVLRNEKNLTQADIAEMLNVGRPTIAGYEARGKEPNYETLEKLADFFNVSIDYLLGRTDNKDLTKKVKLYKELTTVKEATEYLIKIPAMAAFGGYDLNKMSEQEIIDFANEIMHQFELVSHRYKK